MRQVQLGSQISFSAPEPPPKKQMIFSFNMLTTEFKAERTDIRQASGKARGFSVICVARALRVLLPASSTWHGSDVCSGIFVHN